MNLLACLTPAAWRERPSGVPWLPSRVHPEYKQAHMQATHSGHKPCLLELVPDSWWLQFIHMLPHKDKLALFQVSMQLAIRLMQNSNKVDFQLYHRVKRGQQVKQGDADTWCSAPTQLLHMLSSLKVAVQTRKQRPMPFPVALSSHITAMHRFYNTRKSPSTAVLNWGAFQNLSKLYYISSGIGKQDINRLCNALEAQQLPHLRAVSFMMTREQMMVAKLPDTLAERLARSLGPQLKELSTNAAPLLASLAHFKALHTVHVHFCDLTAAQAQQLCKQPHLQSVSIGVGVNIEGDHGQRSCSWGSLTVHNQSWKLLPALPLASVPHVCVRGCVNASSHTERQLIRALVAKHGDKLVCHPALISSPFLSFPFSRNSLPTFTLERPSEEMLPLLAKLHVPCRLRLERDVLHAGVLHMIWREISSCVGVVTVGYITRVDWVHLWQDLPETVHTLEVDGCEAQGSDLYELICTAPKHVLAIDLAPWPCQYAQWEADGLRDGMSGHVEVRIRRVR